MDVFLGFDFYGAGNVGDDLMLDGALDVAAHVPILRLVSHTPNSLPILSRRFPRVRWLEAGSSPRADAVRECGCWLGIGDTPIQITSGTWFLEHLLAEAALATELDKPMYLLGVGAEAEALSERVRFGPLLAQFSGISTRDRFSYALIVDELGVEAGRVVCGSDLANISLRRLFPSDTPNRRRPYDLGVIYYSERPTSVDSSTIRAFVLDRAESGAVAFIANDTRRGRGFERDLYRGLLGGWRALARRRIPLVSPDYSAADVRALVAHFADFAVVFSGRYHGLLAAAWAGCRVAALERGSKVDALAEQLGVPIVRSPYSPETLDWAYRNAPVIPRRKLALLADQSWTAARRLLENLAG